MLMDNIKKFRTEKKLSLRALSEKSGVSKTTINEIENGIVTNPTIDTIEKIAKALDKFDEELINDDLAELAKNVRIRPEIIPMNKLPDITIGTSYAPPNLNHLEERFLQYLIAYLKENDFTLWEMKEILHYIEFMIVKKREESNIF